MTLIVEDGTIVAWAESLASVAQADDYLTKIGFAQWLTMTETQKEQALRRGTLFMSQRYRSAWAGLRVSADQALDWPRSGVVVDGFRMLSSTAIPNEIISACIMLAYKAAHGDLYPDQARAKIKTKLDVIEVEYDRYSSQQTKYASIDAMLMPFLSSAGGIGLTSVRLVK